MVGQNHFKCLDILFCAGTERAPSLRGLFSREWSRLTPTFLQQFSQQQTDSMVAWVRTRVYCVAWSFVSRRIRFSACLLVKTLGYSTWGPCFRSFVVVHLENLKCPAKRKVEDGQRKHKYAFDINWSARTTSCNVCQRT
jgi:hypothetical protein